jgi:creatinine amidohydrolase
MTKALRWEELTREEIADAAPTCVTLFPVAATEQHGPHLATTTDTALVSAIAVRACDAASSPVLLAPTLCFGASDHHLPFGGTLSLQTTTLLAVLRDLVRSMARTGCQRVLLLNGHGGNASVCSLAASDSAREHGIVVAAMNYWERLDPPGGFKVWPGHAGAFETSLMAATHPELVRPELARPSPGQLGPRDGVRINDPAEWRRIDGFTDDPRDASAQAGERLLASCAEIVSGAIDALANALVERTR